MKTLNIIKSLLVVALLVIIISCEKDNDKDYDKVAVNREIYFDMLFENIFKFIVDNKKIMDVRRYVGVPCYSFIDYFNFFGVENDY